MNQGRFLFLLLLSLLLLSCNRPKILSIEPEQIINESGYGTAMHWFDEPDTTSVPLSSWETPGIESYWPAGVIIDFGSEIMVDHLVIFDANKSGLNKSGEWEHRAGEIRVSGGKPFEWKEFAARYGHQKVESQRLRVVPGEAVTSGAGLLNYYECWNEPDRWWGLAASHFTPYELAAMTSAANDGHMQSMGENFGVKNADPGAKLVMGGLTSLDLQYMDAMLLWTKHKRKGSFPADVINFHHYNNTAGKQHQSGKVDMFQLQAIWLVRGYLLGAASGIDRMFMYLANDLGDDGLYRNCGLVFKDLTPKRSWYYVSTLKKVLSGTRYAGELETDRKDMCIYRFKNKDRKVLALWCPTSDGSTVDLYTLKLPGDCSQIRLIEMSAGLKEGIRTPLKAEQGAVKINISEQPVFVEYLLNP